MKTNEAFTLVEVIFTIILVALFCGLILPATQRARSGSRRSSCMSNARQIGLAFKQYAVDNNDCFPAIGSSSNSVRSSSVFMSLTNGGYLAIGKIYICPQDNGKRTGSSASFGPSNNSYACVVSNSLGVHGLTEAISSDNPLIFDDGLAGAPDYVVNLTNAKWKPYSPHKTDGGSIFYAGGQAGFRKFFDTGADGTNGYVVRP